MRCLICGRPIAGTESRYSKETMDCQGCQSEFKTLVAGGMEPADAMAKARQSHETRELAIYHALSAKDETAKLAAAKKVADDWYEAVK